jgi:hypothetical protein
MVELDMESEGREPEEASKPGNFDSETIRWYPLWVIGDMRAYAAKRVPVSAIDNSAKLALVFSG